MKEDHDSVNPRVDVALVRKPVEKNLMRFEAVPMQMDCGQMWTKWWKAVD